MWLPTNFPQRRRPTSTDAQGRKTCISLVIRGMSLSTTVHRTVFATLSRRQHRFESGRGRQWVQHTTPMNAVAKASATTAEVVRKDRAGHGRTDPGWLGPPNAPNVTHASPTCASLDCQGGSDRWSPRGRSKPGPLQRRSVSCGAVNCSCASMKPTSFRPLKAVWRFCTAAAVSLAAAALTVSSDCTGGGCNQCCGRSQHSPAIGTDVD
jgi:hypothetical protein